jgi:hypothetical protein
MQYAVTYSYDDENGERIDGVKVFSIPFDAKKYSKGDWLKGPYRPGIMCALFEVDSPDASKVPEMIKQKRAKLFGGWRDCPPDYEWWNDSVLVDDFFKDA